MQQIEIIYFIPRRIALRPASAITAPHPRPFSHWEKGDLFFNCWAVLAGRHAFHWDEPNGDGVNMRSGSWGALRDPGLMALTRYGVSRRYPADLLGFFFGGEGAVVVDDDDFAFFHEFLQVVDRGFGDFVALGAADDFAFDYFQL